MSAKTRTIPGELTVAEGLILRYVADERVTFFPAYKSDEAAGFDVAVCQNIVVPRCKHVIAPTGLRFELPKGYEIQVRSRSGLAAEKGGWILNSPGTFDSDYKGELMLVIANTGIAPLRLKAGDRAAQCIVAPVLRVVLEKGTKDDLRETKRGEGRFGSTGN